MRIRFLAFGGRFSKMKVDFGIFGFKYGSVVYNVVWRLFILRFAPALLYGLAVLRLWRMLAIKVCGFKVVYSYIINEAKINYDPGCSCFSAIHSSLWRI